MMQEASLLVSKRRISVWEGSCLSTRDELQQEEEKAQDSLTYIYFLIFDGNTLVFGSFSPFHLKKGTFFNSDLYQPLCN